MSRDRDDGAGRGRAGDEAFASRWSRLKRQDRPPSAETPETPTPEAAPGSAAAQAADERSDAEILSELGLPDPDTLKAGDDFKAFLASAVPARIRNRALRRLWSSNPVLANLDRLVDYDDDFTDAAMVPEMLRTGYKVGRGWIEDADAEEEAGRAGDDAEGAAEADAGAPAEGGSEGAREGTSEGSGEGSGAKARAEAATEPAPAEPPAEPRRFGEARAESGARRETETPVSARPRRMRFRFAEK